MRIKIVESMSATPINVNPYPRGEIVYEPFSAEMHSEVIELWKKCFNGEEVVFHQDIRIAASSSTGLLHVARSGMDLVGTVLGATDGHRNWIYYLCVERGYRRRGIASHLLGIAEAKLCNNGTRQIGLLVLNRSPGAMNFYRARGYNIEKVRCMCKRLG